MAERLRSQTYVPEMRLLHRVARTSVQIRRGVWESKQFEVVLILEAGSGHAGRNATGDREVWVSLQQMKWFGELKLKFNYPS